MNLHSQRWKQPFATLPEQINQLPAYRVYGQLTRVTGLILEATGLQLPLGAVCRVEPNQPQDRDIDCEVVGFDGAKLLLMPYHKMIGVMPGARIYCHHQYSQSPSSARVFPLGEQLLGRVIDAQGQPLDGKAPLNQQHAAALHTPPLNPLLRRPVTQTLDVGVRAINGLLTVGRGQRMGLFAGSGVGKSRLLGMMARYTEADIIVVGLIGERGREVKEFIDNILGDEGLKRAVVVAAPADVSPLLRLQGAEYATRIAEDFRDKGFNVLLIMDSLTRYAMAQREIGLAIGEPPATKGYPPSAFARLPALVERAGNGIDGGGSITAFYTVLTEGDDQQDPIADAARAILDGHIVLSRHLADSGHYPAIDIEISISRVMTELVDNDYFSHVRRFKQLISLYQQNMDLINVGAYVAGSHVLIDTAIRLYPHMMEYLQQQLTEHCDDTMAKQQLCELLNFT
ncbi:flagellar protein export ATPase FliI [Moellerella wisconsensis]|uniref:Flagellar protein export ATPase FliI n=1 Tax=Moellerella wisconsensis TaxID=158849 RepID=A0ACD3YA50_9GAMM|nr:flagellar protein export ATPase FliI [Moellerella wisconsensis]UNH39901.1 flagellar protein export ATPase FliI [Moellerella wisconsensis]